MGPLNQRLNWFGIETKLGAGDVRNEFSARLASGVEKFLSRFVGAEMRFVRGSEKCRFMMIKPPGETIGGGIFEVNNRILIAIEHLQVEECAGAMEEAAILDLGVRTNFLFVKAGEGS